jgi:hypothetical protein
MSELVELPKLIENGDIAKIVEIIKKYKLKIENKKIVITDELKKQESEYWDKRQLVKKIMLNSALIN